MTSSATTVEPLALLVPTSILPGEADDLSAPAWEQPASGTKDLFRAFHSLAEPRAARFLLTAEDVSFEGSIEHESSLRLVQISADAGTALPELTAHAALSHFDWAGVIREVGHAMLDEHFLRTENEVSRVFTEAVREVAAIAAMGFAGEPVPLLKIEEHWRGIYVSFLGIWLAGEEQINDMRCHLPAQSWQEGTGFGHPTCLLLDAADVEGRGLKEAAMSAVLLALVFGGAAKAPAGEIKGTAKGAVSKLASFFGGGPGHGEKLVVKTQKLVQDAPRIHRDVLNAPHCDLRVIVNIGAQRAYIVKDGRIAFDTPISTAATGHRTPRGTFTITEKVRSGKMSTIYKCPLPGWMRLGETAVGMHQGDLPGYPASHGCIRMPLESALFIFDHAPTGTPVDVVDSWSAPAPKPAQPALVAGAN